MPSTPTRSHQIISLKELVELSYEGLKVPRALVVDCSFPHEGNNHIMVDVHDKTVLEGSGHEIGVSFWDAAQTEYKNCNSSQIYISEAKFARKGKGKLVANVRTGAKVRPATPQEIATYLELDEEYPRKRSLSPIESHSAPIKFIKPDTTEPARDVAASPAVLDELRDLKAQLSLLKSQTSSSSSVVVPAEAVTERPPSPPAINYAKGKSWPEGDFEYTPNPNIEFSLNDLKLVSMVDMEAKSAATKSKLQYRICGQVVSYEPDFAQWIRPGGQIQFTLHMNDGSRGRDLPVIFTGKPAWQFLDLRSTDSNLEKRIERQMSYVKHHWITTAVEIEEYISHSRVIRGITAMALGSHPTLEKRDKK